MHLPRGAWVVVAQEFCERFAYYGIMAVLPLYLVAGPSLSQSDAVALIHTFKALAYVSPIAGALLADAVLGKYATIMAGSVVYQAALVLLTLCVALTAPLGLLGVALLLLALGTGAVKGCVSALMGDQLPADATATQLERAFQVFYWSINLGALLSFVAVPFLRMYGGYAAAFATPTLFFAAATLLLVLGRAWIVRPAAESGRLGLTLRVALRAIFRRPLDAYAPALQRDAKALLQTVTALSLLPVFWALFDQQSSRWTFQMQSGEREGCWPKTCVSLTCQRQR